MIRLAIVVTGLPGSGKSTIGRTLAKALSYPCLDKYDFLEDLFEEKGVGDRDWRRRLSVEADARFKHAAIKHGDVVLVSHWRPAAMKDTGTPTDWLTSAFDKVIEVYCECAPELAAQRFVTRRRHIGHLDAERPQAEVLGWMTRLAEAYPIKLGPSVRVSTEGEVSTAELASKIKQLLA